MALPCKPPLSKYRFSVKVTTCDFLSEFFIFPESFFEQQVFLAYIRLSSNGMIQQVLETSSMTVTDQEIQLLSEVAVLKIGKTHSNSISHIEERMIVKPVKEESFEAPEKEEIEARSFDQDLDLSLDQEEVHAELVPFHSRVASKDIPQTPESIRKTGISLLWNFDLENAKSHFEQIKSNDLRATLHLAEVNLFQVLVTGRKSDVLKSSEALQEAEKFCDKSKEEFSDIVQAEISLLKSVLLLVSGQKLKAFITMRSAWKNYKKYEASLARIQDSDILGRAYFGLGLFMLIMSLVPTSIATILRLAGFCSNREKGLDYLFRCKNLHVSRSPFASIVLGLFYIDMEPNFPKAESLIEEYLQIYPSCVLFYWVSSVVSWKLNKVDGAVALLHTALHCCGKALSKKAAFIKYELGWFYFLRLEWKNSRCQFEEILLDTLSLSSELDAFVKEALTSTGLSKDSRNQFESLYNRGVSTKKQNKGSWIDGSSTKKDRVFIPHKSCLIAQLAGCLAAQGDPMVEFWLKVTKISAATPTASRTKLDEEFGTLSQCFLRRRFKELLPYEIIYFLKQHTKLLPNMLIRIYHSAESVIEKISSEKGWKTEKNQNSLVEWASAKMLQIMALSLNGDTSDASAIADETLPLLKGIPDWCRYVVPHTLYWCSRAYGAELRFEDAINVLSQAQKHKNYSFNIRGKILKVLDDMKNKV
jgi:tetratricopeptide (TPR) repeat protein